MDDAMERPGDWTADTEPPRDSASDPSTEPGAGEPPADGAPSRDEMSVAFTPAQLAVGGAVVAGLVVVVVRLLLGRRRGRP